MRAKSVAISGRARRAAPVSPTAAITTATATAITTPAPTGSGPTRRSASAGSSTIAHGRTVAGRMGDGVRVGLPAFGECRFA